MKRRNALGGIVLVMATGMALPGSGCFLFGDEEQEAWEICASSIDGDAHCVAGSDGPNDAWKKVVANGGTEPIQMWVARTDRAEFDEWVSYPGTVDAYLDYTREILDYVRVTQGNAESYRATLAGRLGQDLMDARRAQEKIIADKVLDPKTRVESPLFDRDVHSRCSTRCKCKTDRHDDQRDEIVGADSAIRDDVTRRHISAYRFHENPWRGHSGHQLGSIAIHLHDARLYAGASGSQ